MSFSSLLARFGHSAFRPGQEEIVRHVLSARHALVIMPTGMGKSLCYQIPALELAHRQQQEHGQPDRPGLTLVLSPLIALMQDQVASLRARGIPATYINSTLSADQRQDRYQRLREGDYELAYVTPERFRKQEFLDALKYRRVWLLAVDEAHCISQWGHDFRPDYSRLRELRRLLGDPTTVAATATATPRVQSDIIRQLDLETPAVRVFHHGIDRPNLHLAVESVWGDRDKLQWIETINDRHAGSGIVYFTLIRTLERFSEMLRRRGAWHLVYHGELPSDQRRRIQDAFMEDAHLVLATNAFGMGIDKDSIRFVVHAELPGSLEAYYQEIGRAGRDGHDAECRLLYDPQDLETQLQFIQWSNPGADFFRRLVDVLIRRQEQVNAFGLEWLRAELSFKQRHDRRLETALGLLDRYDVIEGSLQRRNLRVIAELPEGLQQPEALGDKLRGDHLRLHDLVRYVQYSGDRQQFLREYFVSGLSEARGK